MNNLYSTRKVQTNNYSGFTGVSWNRHNKKWRVQIFYGYDNFHLGYFKHFEDAVYVRKKAETARELFRSVRVSSIQKVVYFNAIFFNSIIPESKNQEFSVEVFFHEELPCKKQ